MSFAGFSSLGNPSQAAQRPGEGSTTQPATTGAFGQPLAGASSNAQPGGASSSPFGAFGSTQSNQPAQQQGQAGGSNIFGTSPFGGSSTATSGGLAGGTGFGSTPAINVSNPNGSTTTSLFPPGGTGGSTFGSTLAPPTANSGLFPSSQGTSTAGTSGSSPFGQAGQQQQSSGTGTSAFKPFGTSTTSFAGPNSGFGSSTLGQSVLGASTLNSSVGQQGPATNANSIEAQIQAIEAAITPGSPNNRFQYYFYNLVDADQIHLYGRPQNATNEALWQRANRENPNPSRLVPALAVGFEDLKKRADAQKSQVDGQLAAIRLLKREVEKLSTKHTLTILPLAQKLNYTHAQLAARLAALIHHLHLFIPSLRGASLRREEEALRTKLEALENELTGRSDALGRAGGRMAELWGVVGRVKAQKEAGYLHGIGEGGGWAVVDEAAFEQIKSILINEQQGLKFLTDVLRTALRDIDTVRSGFNGLDLSSPTP